MSFENQRFIIRLQRGHEYHEETRRGSDHHYGLAQPGDNGKLQPSDQAQR